MGGVEVPKAPRGWGGGCGPSQKILRIFVENIIFWRMLYFLNHMPMGGVLTPLIPSSVRQWEWDEPPHKLRRTLL